VKAEDKKKVEKEEWKSYFPQILAYSRLNLKFDNLILWNDTFFFSAGDGAEPCI
jgi:hypothetical protein